MDQNSGDFNLAKDQRAIIARRFLVRARKDYDAFAKLAGDIRLPVLYQRKILIDSALCIYLLQQSCEKAVKAVAIASGQFKPETLVRDYRHDSLRLWIDLYLKLLIIPSFAQSITIVKSRLGPKADKLVTVPEAQETLEKIKQNTRYYKDRPEGIQDWLAEFATLPPEQFGQVVSMLKTLHHNLASGIYAILEPNIEINVPSLNQYLAEPTSANLINALAPSFRNKAEIQDMDLVVELMNLFMGRKFDQALAEAAGNELTDPRVQTVKIGKRSNFEKRTLSGFALSTLMFVSAFTFPHEQSSRYPIMAVGNVENGLDCDSYSGNLGIVANLHDLGYVINLTITDLDEMLNMISELFDQISAGYPGEPKRQ